MAHYSSSDLQFQYPDSWIDRSMIAFASNRTGTIAENVLCMKDLAKFGDDPNIYADRQIKEAQSVMKSFVLINRREAPISSIPAVEIDFTWENDHTYIRQKQNFVVVGTLFYTITFTSLASEALEFEDLFGKIRGTIILTPTG